MHIKKCICNVISCPALWWLFCLVVYVTFTAVLQSKLLNFTFLKFDSLVIYVTEF